MPSSRLCVLIALLASALLSFPVRAEDPAAEFAVAEEKFREKDYEDALAAYRAFAEKYPKDWRAAQARFTEAFILQKKLSRLPQARQAYENVIKQDGAHPFSRSAQYHIAQSYEQSGDTPKAIRAYDDLLKKGPKGPREPGVKRKLDFLRKHAEGKAEDPPGWGERIERKHWRKAEKGEQGEKHAHRHRVGDPNRPDPEPTD
ncbi:MAG TPA: tetratricopeptide repeat protein [Planctomycetota bacterium]|jgi:tetratricopeptide (TPR) repeat protein